MNYTEDTSRNDASVDLKYEWSVWHNLVRKENTPENWMANQVVLTTIKTTDDVQRFATDLVNLDSLGENQDLAILRDGVEPRTEEKRNIRGGQWLVVLNQNSPDYSVKFERVWCAFIALCFEEESSPLYHDVINGFSLAVRDSKYVKLFLWLSNQDSVFKTLDIGMKLRELCAIDDPFLFLDNTDKRCVFVL